MPQFDPVIQISWESAEVRGRAEPLPTDLRERVISIEYTDKTRGADKFKITLDNSDLSLFDDPRVAPGNKLHVQWGYVFDVSLVHVITIEKHSGWKQFSLECLDSSEFTAISSQRTRSFEQQTPWEIAETIARELGFRSENSRDIEAPTNAPRRNVTQAGETDYAFLTRLATGEDNVFRIRGNQFHFHPTRIGDEPTFTVSYWSDTSDLILAGEPNFSQGTLGLPARTARRGVDVEERETVEGQAGNQDDTERDCQGGAAILVDPGSGAISVNPILAQQRREDYELAYAMGRENMSVFDPPMLAEVTPSSAQSEDEAQTQATGAFRRRERRAIELSIPVIGSPRIEADITIRLTGVGQSLTGNYQVVEVTHKIGSGYVCDLKLKRNARSRSSASGQRRRAVNRQEVQRIRRQIAILDRMMETMVISYEAYNRRIAHWQDRLEAAESGEAPATNEVTGRVNNTEQSDPRRLRRRHMVDGDTGRRTVSYAQPGSSQGRTGGWAE